jgi:hypothetical protein
MADVLEKPAGSVIEPVLEQNQQEVDMLKLDLDYRKKLKRLVYVIYCRSPGWPKRTGPFGEAK